jgi:hypothetical protein
LTLSLSLYYASNSIISFFLSNSSLLLLLIYIFIHLLFISAMLLKSLYWDSFLLLPPSGQYGNQRCGSES